MWFTFTDGACEVLGFDRYISFRFFKRIRNGTFGYTGYFGHGSFFRIVPGSIADMNLAHKVIPLSVGYCLMIIIGQDGVALKTGYHFIRPVICFRIFLGCQRLVLGLGVIHII